MAVRSALPWPFRWAVIAIVFGFCASIGLWAFEFGKDIAGLDRGSKQEIARLQAQISALEGELEKAKDERDKAQSIANTAGTLVTVEKASGEKVLQQIKQLEADNRSLKDDLGFFEKLIPSSGVDGVAIRGLQADLQGDATLKWQVLVIQASKNAAEFNGRLELTFTGTLAGKPWSVMLPQLAVKVRQYGRLEGLFEIPAQVLLKGVSARILEGTTVRATQAIKL
jgi:DNA-binding protein YbaB